MITKDEIKMSKPLGLLLHPVRLRILQTLMPNNELTVQEIGEMLSDIPPATLYRHVNKLRDGKVIEVKSQQQIRGAVESRYVISTATLQSVGKDINDLTNEQHLQYFTVFTSFLLAEYKRYLDRPEKDLEKDGVGYRYLSVYLSDDEFEEWLSEYRALLERILTLPRTPERKKRMIANIFILDEE